MGVWGPKVLQNDACEDYMYEIYRMLIRCSANIIHDRVESLLSHSDSPNYSDEYRLLGVAIVDASMHDFDTSLLHDHLPVGDVEYEFFKYMKLAPLPDLIPKAKEVLKALIEQGVDNWSERSKESRMQLYQTYMSRLEEVE